jgi:hypothetical protein
VNICRNSLRGIENGRIKIGEFNERVDAPGLDTILTFQQLRNRL